MPCQTSFMQVRVVHNLVKCVSCKFVPKARAMPFEPCQFVLYISTTNIRNPWAHGAPKGPPGALDDATQKDGIDNYMIHDNIIYTCIVHISGMPRAGSIRVLMFVPCQKSFVPVRVVRNLPKYVACQFMPTARAIPFDPWIDP